MKSEWLGTPPELPSEFDAELAADVLVIGGGLAGICAVRSAAEMGASVILIERSGSPAGRSGDVAAFHSRIWERYPSLQKYQTMRRRIVDNLLKDSLYRVRNDIYERWADESGDAFDWFIGAVPPEKLFIGSDESNECPEDYRFAVISKAFRLPEHFDVTTEYFPSYPVTARLVPGIRDFLRENLRVAEETGNLTSALFNTAAYRLLTADGRISGAVAKDNSGRHIKIAASKWVVLATGDFLSNSEMVRRYVPKVWENGFRPDGSGTGRNYYNTRDASGERTNTGDGHRMGMWAGAIMQQDGCPCIHHGGGAVVGSNPTLMLNKKGERFMNEDVHGAQMEHRLEEQPGMTIYQFFDGAISSQLQYMPFGHHKVYTFSQKELDRAVERGDTLKGDTLEELLSKLDIDAETAKRSIAQYNESARIGTDRQFGKRADRMFPLDTAPFYCNVWEKGAALCTLSGLTSDSHCHTYDAEYNIIPGLYVAGNVQGNRFAIEYPTTVLGLSHSMALLYGRIAGQNASDCR